MNILEARRRVLGGEVIKRTAEGNPISVRSLARRYPGIAMQGWTEQAQYEGKNLFDFSKFTATGTVGGSLDFENKTVTINANRNNWYPGATFAELCPNIEIGKTYTINADTTNPDSLKQVYFDNATVYWLFGESLTITEEILNSHIAFYNNGLSSEENIVSQIMVNEGSTALPYEPYTGGAPSPSPDYPQEIVSAGKHIEATEDTEEQWQYEIGVGGAQLIPFPYFNSSTQNGGITYKVSENGEVEYYGTITSLGTNFLFSFKNFLLDAGQYTLSYKGELGDNIHLRAYNNDLLTTIGVVNPTLTFTLDATTKVMIYLNSAAIGSAVNGHITPMLNKGSEPLPFELYKHSSVTLTSDRPLTKWDRLEKRNGQWGWVYKSEEIESYTDESVPGEYFSTTGQLSTGAQVWYETTTETFVPLTASEQEQMNNLYTYRPTTVLSNDQNCEMELTYKTRKSMEVTT